jgi:hypothetical protein
MENVCDRCGEEHKQRIQDVSEYPDTLMVDPQLTCQPDAAFRAAEAADHEFGEHDGSRQSRNINIIARHVRPTFQRLDELSDAARAVVDAQYNEAPSTLSRRW